MPESAHIAFAMTGDVHRNSRALRQLGALSGAGYRVALYCFPKGDIHSELPLGVDFRPVSVAGTGGARFFLNVHKAFSAALEGVPAALFHASDLYVLHAVRGAASRRAARLTYDARELYAHVSATVGRPHVSAFWKWVERTGIRKADHVWTVSEPIAKELSRAYGIAAPEVQMNAPAITLLGTAPGITLLGTAPGITPPGITPGITPLGTAPGITLPGITPGITPLGTAPGITLPGARPHGNVGQDWIRQQAGLPDSSRIVLHLGQMRKDRGGERLVGAMGHVPDSADLHLVFLGYGPERDHLASLAQKSGLGRRVHFLPPIPPADLRQAASGANAGVTLLEPSCLNHRLALPNKLFDYLAAGLPVVASDLPAIAGIVGPQDCGILVDPRDEIALASALVRAASDSPESTRWARNARAAAETFDWNVVSQRYLDRIGALIGPP